MNINYSIKNAEVNNPSSHLNNYRFYCGRTVFGYCRAPAFQVFSQMRDESNCEFYSQSGEFRQRRYCI